MTYIYDYHHSISIPTPFRLLISHRFFSRHHATPTAAAAITRAPPRRGPDHHDRIPPQQPTTGFLQRTKALDAYTRSSASIMDDGKVKGTATRRGLLRRPPGRRSTEGQAHRQSKTATPPRSTTASSGCRHRHHLHTLRARFFPPHFAGNVCHETVNARPAGARHHAGTTSAHRESTTTAPAHQPGSRSWLQHGEEGGPPIPAVSSYTAAVPRPPQPSTPQSNKHPLALRRQ